VLLPHGPFGRQAHRSLQPEQEQEQGARPPVAERQKTVSKWADASCFRVPGFVEVGNLEKTRPGARAGNDLTWDWGWSRSKAPLEDSLEARGNGKTDGLRVGNACGPSLLCNGLLVANPTTHRKLKRNQRRRGTTEIVVAICLECPWTRCFHGLAHIDRALQTRSRALLSQAATGWRTGRAPPRYPILFYFTCAIPFPKRHT
jgi:hypothetical protein